MKDVIHRQVRYGRQFRINWCAFCNIMSITRLFVIDISNSIKWLSELYSIDSKLEPSQRETMPHKRCLWRILAISVFGFMKLARTLSKNYTQSSIRNTIL